MTPSNNSDLSQTPWWEQIDQITAEPSFTIDRQNTVTGKWISLVDVGVPTPSQSQKPSTSSLALGQVKPEGSRFKGRNSIFASSLTCFARVCSPHARPDSRDAWIKQAIQTLTGCFRLDQPTGINSEDADKGVSEGHLYQQYIDEFVKQETAGYSTEVHDKVQTACKELWKTWIIKRQVLLYACARMGATPTSESVVRQKFVKTKDHASYKTAIKQLGLDHAIIDKHTVGQTLLARLFRAVCRTIDSVLEAKPVKNANLLAIKEIDQTDGWKLLDRRVYGEEQLREVGQQIVLYGMEQAINHPRTHVHAPVMQVKNLKAVYRRDVENYQAIHGIIKEYQDHEATKPKPISIGVFGAPGGGKSYGVTQIGKSFSNIEPVTFNVSQMEGVDGIRRAMTEIRDINLRNKIPLAFFDEFDAPLNNQPLGWLKYFLAPMQDGTIDSPGYGTLLIGRAIFVFAGGICKTFHEFSHEENHHFSADNHAKAFATAKAPDFISRLRGHIDIPTINHEDHTPFIQRAIILRAELESRGLVAMDEDGGVECQRAKIDKQVVAAILDVKTFKHGARSISAILDMCVPFDQWIKVSSLPILKQLRMHMEDQDAQNFYSTLQRGS